jgi:hypothetical protein
MGMWGLPSPPHAGALDVGSPISFGEFLVLFEEKTASTHLSVKALYLVYLDNFKNDHPIMTGRNCLLIVPRNRTPDGVLFSQFLNHCFCYTTC